jgi:hypothetical protein
MPNLCRRGAIDQPKKRGVETVNRPGELLKTTSEATNSDYTNAASKGRNKPMISRTRRSLTKLMTQGPGKGKPSNFQCGTAGEERRPPDRGRFAARTVIERVDGVLTLHLKGAPPMAFLRIEH